MADVFQMVTDRIIAELEECEKNGTKLPWHKGWCRPKFKHTKIKVGADANTVAYNGHSGVVYSFLNQMLLGKAGAYLTFKQITDLGGHVNKGAKSSFVVFWEMLTKTETDNECEEVVRQIPMLRYYSVFHVATQTSGIDEGKLKLPTEILENIGAEVEGEQTWNNNDIIDEVIDSYCNKYNIGFRACGSDRAFYSPSSDSITVPHKSQFKELAEYYGTVLHECVHSTGHKSRLDRLCDNGLFGFGSTEYAKEELVAEIGSSVLCNIFRIDTEQSNTNTTAYIQSWLSALRNDKKLIVYASSKAEKAVEMICNE